MGWTCDGDSTPSVYRQAIDCDETQLSGSGHDIYWLITKDFVDKFRDTDEPSSIASGGQTLRVCSNDDGTGRLAIDIVSCIPNATGSNADILIAVEGAGFNDSTSNQKLYVFWGGSGNIQPASSATYGSDSVYPSTCKALWTMDEDPSGSAPQMIDRTASGHDLTSNGSMTSGDSVSGEIRNALDLDGTDDYLSVADSNDWDNDPVTLILWINWNTVPTMDNWWEESFVAHDEGGGSGSDKWIWTWEPSTDKFLFHINHSGGSPNVNIRSSSTWTPSSGTWYQISVTRSGSSWTFYVDGTSNGTATDSTAFPANTASLTVGYGEGSGSVLPAKIDMASIHHAALSSDWLLSYFNNTNSSSTMFSAGTFTDESGGPSLFIRNRSLSGNLQTIGV